MMRQSRLVDRPTARVLLAARRRDLLPFRPIRIDQRDALIRLATMMCSMVGSQKMMKMINMIKVMMALETQMISQTTESEKHSKCQIYFVSVQGDERVQTAAERNENLRYLLGVLPHLPQNVAPDP